MRKKSSAWSLAWFKEEDSVASVAKVIFGIDALNGLLFSSESLVLGPTICIDHRKQIWVVRNTLRTGEQQHGEYFTYHAGVIASIGRIAVTAIDGEGLWLTVTETAPSTTR